MRWVGCTEMCCCSTPSLYFDYLLLLIDKVYDLFFMEGVCVSMSSNFKVYKRIFKGFSVGWMLLGLDGIGCIAYVEKLFSFDTSLSILRNCRLLVS